MAKTVIVHNTTMFQIRSECCITVWIFNIVLHKMTAKQKKQQQKYSSRGCFVFNTVIVIFILLL